MGRSLSAAIDDFTAGFAREEAPLRGEKAEPVAVIAARVKREYFICICCCFLGFVRSCNL
jgi:hypothetical protein